MGMYDSLIIDVECQKCHQVTKDDDVQFYARLGKYEPNLRHYHLGEAMQSPWPTIQFFVAEGYASCRNCKELVRAKVEIRNGFITRMVLLGEDEGLDFSLPLPRDSRKTTRRKATSDEKFARDCQEAYGNRDCSLEQAIGLSMRAQIGYASWAGQIFKIRPMGVKRLGNYEKLESGVWVRNQAV